MTDTSKQWIKDLYEIKDQSALSWSVYFDGEFFTEFGDREDAKEYVSDQVAHWTRLIAKHAPERAQVKDWMRDAAPEVIAEVISRQFTSPHEKVVQTVSQLIASFAARAEQSTETPPTRVCPECCGDGCAKCDPIGTIRKVCNGEIQINGGEDEDLDVVLKYIESLLPVAEAPRPVEPGNLP